MNGPKAGDVLLRGSIEEGFLVTDAVTGRIVHEAFLPLQEALRVAGWHQGVEVWQQSVDNRGRALGEPFRLTRLAS
jgi:hypothetical protein